MTNATRAVLLAIAVALALVLAYFLRRPLILIYVSLVFAVILAPAVDWVERRRIFGWSPSRGVSILLIVLGVLLALGLLLFFGLPPIVADIQALAERLPEHIRQLNQWIQEQPFGGWVDLGALERYAGALIGGITGLLANLVIMIAALVTAIILTAYFILDGERVFHWAISLFPADRRGRLESALRRAGARMRRWLVGQAILMLILGSYSLIVFGLLGVRYFYVLAVFAGVANIIPMLGPIITVIIAGLIAALDSVGKFIAVVALYGAYQQVESAYLTPRIMESQVKISATAVLVALLIGAELAGIAGALVSVPSAVLVSVLVDEYLVQREAAPSEPEQDEPRLRRAG